MNHPPATPANLKPSNWVRCRTNLGAPENTYMDTSPDRRWLGLWWNNNGTGDHS